MKKSKFSEVQIATVLRQVEAGAPIPEVTRALGISEADVLRLAQAIWPDGDRRDAAAAAAGGRASQAQTAGRRSDAR
jgi:hypothetical protein